MANDTVIPGTPISEDGIAYANIHPHVLLPLPPHIDWLDEDAVEIDELMVPLIRAVWDAGLTTVDCCQGEPDDETASISFGNINELIWFLDCVGDAGSRDEVFDRLPKTCALNVHDMGGWDGPEDQERDPDAPCSHRVYPAVWIELIKADIPELARRFTVGASAWA